MKLESQVTALPGVGDYYAKKLGNLGIKKVKDLLYHVPSRYLDFRQITKIAELKMGETAAIRGGVVSTFNRYGRSGKQMQIVRLADETKKIDAVWFNQPYLLRTFKKGVTLFLVGQLRFMGKKRVFAPAEFEVGANGKEPSLISIYPETKGLSSKWLRKRLEDALARVEFGPDFLSQKTLKKLGLPALSPSLKKIHFPSSLTEAERARERLGFNELLFLHLAVLKRKLDWEINTKSEGLKLKKTNLEKFLENLPFSLTLSQKRSVKEVLLDMEKETPMNRILVGDVGSGKTVVAASAIFAAFVNSAQSALMAPTQILAHQHYQTLKELLGPFNLRVSLLTAKLKKESVGRADLFVGTHALIHKLNQETLGLVVIDEQHRFGVRERAHLARKLSAGDKTPHVLTMTATPIPRTVAMTAYGDLALSTLDELPKGREKTTTWIIPNAKRLAAYEWLEESILKEKSQAFVICPLIEESESFTLKETRAAKELFTELSRKLRKIKLGLLHGRQGAKEKELTLRKFKEGKIDLLVATPVVEVGIDVPNAAIIVVESADRFGLAQLHQLRGRVGRGAKKSYAILISEAPSKKTKERLSLLKSDLSGRELAEADLTLRGPGEIFGLRQHGVPELKIASYRNVDLIRKSKKFALEVTKSSNQFRQLQKSLGQFKI